MNSSDVKVLSRLGRSVWVNSEDWERSTLEVVTAVSLLDLPEERAAERAAGLLLGRARRAEVSDATPDERDLWMSPFYRLPVDQRLILAALHGAGWSYLRLSRILGISIEEVERLAWNARIQLTLPAVFPAALGKMGASCPEYDPSRPWTQRFLDDEIASKRDLLFIQSHLMTCDSCQRTLEKSRGAYYEAEKRVPSGQEGDSLAQSLDQILVRNPMRTRTLAEEFFVGFRAFLKRRDIRWVVILSVLAFSYWWFQKR